MPRRTDTGPGAPAPETVIADLRLPGKLAGPSLHAALLKMPGAVIWIAWNGDSSLVSPHGETRRVRTLGGQRISAAPSRWRTLARDPGPAPTSRLPLAREKTRYRSRFRLLWVSTV